MKKKKNTNLLYEQTKINSNHKEKRNNKNEKKPVYFREISV